MASSKTRAPESFKWTNLSFLNYLFSPHFHMAYINTQLNPEMGLKSWDVKKWDLKTISVASLMCKGSQVLPWMGLNESGRVLARCVCCLQSIPYTESNWFTKNSNRPLLLFFSAYIWNIFKCRSFSRHMLRIGSIFTPNRPEDMWTIGYCPPSTSGLAYLKPILFVTTTRLYATFYLN